MSEPLINNASAIFQDRAGTFWIGSLLGLYTYNEKRNQWLNFREKQEQKFFKSVKTICQDKAGRVWIISLRSEIKFFDGQHWHSGEELSPPVPLPVDNCVLFTGKDGKLWFVTGTGLIAFDGKEWTSPMMPSKHIEEIYAQMPIKYRDEQEEKWAVSERLAQGENERSEKAVKKVKHTDILLPTIYHGLQDRYGSIWLGARKAIVRFNPKENAWKVYPLQGLVEVRLIYEDRQGRLWFADEQGHLSVYNQKLGNWKSYDLSIYFPQIQPKRITSIYQSKAGQIMIGTRDGLVLFMERENRWRILSEGNPNLPVYGVTAIVEDKLGRIWISESQGILVLEQ